MSDMIDEIKNSGNNKNKRYLKNNGMSNIVYLDEKGERQILEINKEVIVLKSVADNLLKLKGIVDLTEELKKKSKDL